MLAEIPEASAPPNIGVIYSDMRAVMGVPFVNLVYRHLATIPLALPWVWDALRPHIASGTIEPLADRVLIEAARVHWPNASPVTNAPHQQRAEIGAIIGGYNRGNATNLITLLALLSAGIPPRSSTAVTGEIAFAAERMRTPALENATSFAPLPMDAIAAPLRARIDAIAERQGLAAAGVTPTMYRHLARWPSVLDGVLTYVDAAIDAGLVAATVVRIRAAALAPAQELGAALTSSRPAPTHADRLRMIAVLETFTSRAIPQMIAAGTHLAP